MPSLVKRLFLDGATAATDLAGILWVALEHRPTSILCFVGTVLDKFSPSSIDNTFVQSTFGRRPIGEIVSMLILLCFGAFAHRGGLQFFKHNSSIGVNQVPTLLVEEITALVGNLPMGLC